MAYSYIPYGLDLGESRQHALMDSGWTPVCPCCLMPTNYYHLKRCRRCNVLYREACMGSRDYCPDCPNGEL